MSAQPAPPPSTAAAHVPPLLAWAAGAALLACHVAFGPASWKAWAAYAGLSALAGLSWIVRCHVVRLPLTGVLRGHGWIQATTALLLAAWQPSLAWASALMWLAAIAWLPWDGEREQALHLPAAQVVLLCAMLAILCAVVVARPMPQMAPGSVAARILWMVSVMLPLAVHALALWQALHRMQRHYGRELAQLSSYCGQLAEDVQQLQARVSTLQLPTGRDTLTGVANFSRLMDAVDGLRERHARKPEPFCVVLLELDPWVERAGAHRPPKGPSLQDRVLLMLSGLLVTHLRAVDGVGRYRDDTFMLVMPDTASVQAVWALQRVREGVRQQHWSEAPVPDPDRDPLTLTLAVAEFQAGETSERLVQRAEMALMHGRASGRNQIVVAEDVRPPRTS
ncbi:GGDEF domain-containing protein [Delftia tsuruhatensis]|uniref:GGDEF domain-containing protein n=1 Tax=Delftia tsuruhatensis TaxID=180282 RepID=UPI001F302D72|nr:GGDEF domain-containing protein [Delftia tsuruhatensis]